MSVVPVWQPVDEHGQVRRDPDDTLAGGPVMRVVFGPEAAVVEQLEPGTLGAIAEDGSLYHWPDMPAGAEYARAAERAFRCALRFADELA